MKEFEWNYKFCKAAFHKLPEDNIIYGINCYSWILNWMMKFDTGSFQTEIT